MERPEKAAFSGRFHFLHQALPGTRGAYLQPQAPKANFTGRSRFRRVGSGAPVPDNEMNPATGPGLYYLLSRLSRLKADGQTPDVSRQA